MRRLEQIKTMTGREKVQKEMRLKMKEMKSKSRKRRRERVGVEAYLRTREGRNAGD